jgi:hypothetical protein
MDVSKSQETLLEDYVLLANRFNIHRCIWNVGQVKDGLLTFLVAKSHYCPLPMQVSLLFLFPVMIQCQIPFYKLSNNPLIKLLMDVSKSQETLLEDYVLLANRFNIHRCSYSQFTKSLNKSTTAPVG